MSLVKYKGYVTYPKRGVLLNLSMRFQKKLIYNGHTFVDLLISEFKERGNGVEN